jgi:hypothetical protein
MSHVVLSYGLYWHKEHIYQGSQSRPRADARTHIWFSSSAHVIQQQPRPCSTPVKGHLLGCPLSAECFKKQTGWTWTGNWRPMVDHAGQAAIYVLYDPDFQIVYIGQAGAQGKSDFLPRLKQHRTPSDPIARRWTFFSWFGLYRAEPPATVGQVLSTPCPPLALERRNQMDTDIGHLADQLEGILITAAEPSLNRQGGVWDHAVQYQQFGEQANSLIL